MTDNSAISDTYIYKPYSDKYIKVLYALSRDLTLQLAKNWLTDPVCYPNLDWSEIDLGLNLDDNDDDEGVEESEQEYFDKKFNSAFEYRKYTPEQRLKLYKTERKGLDILRAEYSYLQQDNTITKRQIVQRIIYDHWPKGLNMAQIAQIDIANTIHVGNSMAWGCSTFYSTSPGKRGSGDVQMKYKHVLDTIEPKRFVQKLNDYIYPLLVSHVSAHSHPDHSLIMVRIQIFETQNINDLQTQPKPNMVSNTKQQSSGQYRINIPPIYLAFPLSSPYIIHSYLPSYLYNVISPNPNALDDFSSESDGDGSDKMYLSKPLNERAPQSLTYLQIILQSLLLTLSRANRQIYLHPFGENVSSNSNTDMTSEEGIKYNKSKRPDNLPSKSLDSMISICSVSRGIAALGPWSIYGLGTAEPLPISAKESRKDKGSTLDDDFGSQFLTQSQAAQVEKRKLVGIRFHGKEPESKKQKSDKEELDHLVVPVFEFKLENKLSNIDSAALKLAESSQRSLLQNKSHTPTITSRFEGKDVFKGLEQLAQLGIMDIEQAPKWLTEQQNVLSVTVKNNTLIRGLQH